jgi:hypothetical protein
MRTALTRGLVAFALGADTNSVGASPNVSLDDPVYDELARRDALRELEPYAGGMAPLSEAHVRRLLGLPSIAPDWWVEPVQRVSASAIAFDEDDRPYSTLTRPRDVEGVIALSCEAQAGLPCGHGEGFISGLDSAAGYGQWVTAAVRLRADTGTAGYADHVAIDRMYASAEIGPAFAEVGRDVVAIGPSARTELAWSYNAPPIDHVRVQTAEPYELSRDVQVSALYLLGQRRDSSEVHPPLVTIARGQLDLGRRVEVALHQELMLGGDGAPGYGVWDFVAEHFRRRDSTAGPTDSSNRRFGGDIAVHLDGARLYYELVFEDIRKELIDALHYDADHLLGIELAALGGKHALVVEAQRTGVRAYEHSPTATQFTNAGRIVGSPLGPDTESLFVAGRIYLARTTLLPSVELVRLSSDTYTFVNYGPIAQSGDGVAEYRCRFSGRARFSLTPQIRLDAQLTFEHVTHLAFVPDTTRDNLGMVVAIVWQPGGFLAK